MANLGPQHINQSFGDLLQLPNGLTSSIQNVQDGSGNVTPLEISTTVVDFPIQSVAGNTGAITDLPTANGANFVGFQQQGTGSVLQSLQDIEAEKISITQFGAVGDGITNDAPSVQNAINRVAVIGRGVVVFPPGAIYYLNSQINLCDNVILWGYGAKIKIGNGFAGINNPLFKNFSGTGFNAPGTRLASQNIGFYGFEIDGNDTGVAGSTVPDANMHGVIICVGGWTANTGVNNFVVRDCTMYSFAGTGVMAWKSTNVTVNGNSFTNFFANTSLSVGSAIDFHEVTRCIVSENRLNHTASGLSWHGMVILDWDAGCKDVIVANNIIANMNNGDGISCESNTYPNIDGGVFDGNIVENCAGDGIHVQGCVDVIISNNILRASTTGGIAVSATNTSTLIIDGNSVNGPYISGIYTNANVLRALISNNRISGMAYYDANYQGEGIFVYTASPSSSASIEIVGNYIKDTAGCGIYSAVPVQATSNYIFNFATSALAIRNFGINAPGSLVNNKVIGFSANGSYGINISDGVTANDNYVSGTFADGKYRIDYRNTVYSGTYVNYNKLISDGVLNTITVWDSAAPTTSRWVIGDITYNTAPTSAGFIGWVCTTAGVPGTWKTFGLIS